MSLTPDPNRPCDQAPALSPPVSLTFLGTGTSHGVPMIGCHCAVCESDDPHDRRTRTSAVVRGPHGALLIDTGPDLRTQALREGLSRVEGILFTHAHADHIMGLDDVRRFNDALGGPLPCWMDTTCRERLAPLFGYCLEPREPQPFHAWPYLVFHEARAPFKAAGLTVVPIPLWHGRMPILGYRFGALAYCTDVKTIPPDSEPLLADLEVLVLEGLRPSEHPSHLSIPEALAIIERLRPRRAYLTHISHAVSHRAVSRDLPPGVALAYDGLTIHCSPVGAPRPVGGMALASPT